MHSQLLVLVLAAISSSALSVSTQCSVADSQKTDCGYIGINQSQCEAKGCCWASSSTSGVPWCYYGGEESLCYSYLSWAQLPFTSAELNSMRSRFNANINIDGKGGVVAAPDYNTAAGSYYFHWMRDGALTMYCFQDTNPNDFSSIESTVKSYVSWVLHNQNEADPNNLDVRGEPKFNLPNGDVNTDGWCRPQSDGPGLRATTLILAAQNLLAQGESSYVKQYLWTGDNNNYHGGAIKFDLDYIVNNYASSTCDLWEDLVHTDFFWNRMTMKKALIVGAQFARTMGDTASATSYENTMLAINATLYANHFNGDFVQECTTRLQDGAVILALNHGFDSLDNLFYPTSYEVAKTVIAYNNLFCGTFPINPSDTSRYVNGVLYGRYPGDVYAGGNPWILTTAALANLFYRGANYILANGVPSAEVLSLWKAAFNSPKDLPTDAKSLSQVFAHQGDAVLLRIREHTSADGFTFYEQINKNTGAQLNAKDLTWSYAEVLNAMHTRDAYYAAL